MFNEWDKKTTEDLLAELDDWIRRSIVQANEHNQALKADKNADMAEARQEVVEKWMMIADLKRAIAKRAIQEAEKSQSSLVRSLKHLSHDEIDSRLKAGIRYFDKQEYPLAIAELNLVLANDLKHGQAYAYRGLAFARLALYRHAANDLTTAIQLQPQRDLYAERARAYSRLHQYSDAIEDLTRVLRTSSNESVLYRDRGSALYEIKQYKKALVDLDQAIRLDPKDEEAYYVRAGVHMELGDYRRAQTDCEIALKLCSEPDLLADRIKEIQERKLKHKR
jgi:tetratricopeptide (TPR) repeat protein